MRIPLAAIDASTSAINAPIRLKEGEVRYAEFIQ